MIHRRTIVALIALSLVLVVRPVSIPTAVACSCAMPDDVMAEAAKEPRAAVFTGIVGVPTPEGLPVGLTRWFKASPPGAVILLDSRGFEDPNGGSCGVNPPPTASEWIFVAGFNERSRLDVNLCTTQADLATPEGQGLLADAEAVFGPAEPIPVVTAPPVSVATAPPRSQAPAVTPATGGPQIPAGALLMAGGAGLLILLGVALVLAARRRA